MGVKLVKGSVRLVLKGSHNITSYCAATLANNKRAYCAAVQRMNDSKEKGSFRLVPEDV